MTRRPAIALAAFVASCALWAGCAEQHGTIGAMLAQRADGGLYVYEVPPGLAADKAGLREGDQILLIDGKDVRMMSEKQVLAELNGQVGAPVKLTVIRGESVLHVTVKRTPTPPRVRRAAK